MTTDPSLFRIASYNIRKAVGLDWRRDPHRIVDVIEEIDADVVVLQEADKRLAPRPGVLPLDRLESELGYALGDFDEQGPSHGWHGNALLYKPQKLGPPTTERIVLPAQEPRGAIAAHFSSPALCVVGTHLALTAGTRRRQLGTLLNYAGLCDQPTVIAGDFNHWGRTLPARGGTVVTPGLSFHASRRIAALDRFILCGPLSYLAAHVHMSMTARQASDHLPIVLDLDLQGMAS